MKQEKKLVFNVRIYFCSRNTGLTHDSVELNALKQGENLMFGENNLQIKENILMANQMWQAL